MLHFRPAREVRRGALAVGALTGSVGNIKRVKGMFDVIKSPTSVSTRRVAFLGKLSVIGCSLCDWKTVNA